MDTGVVGEGLAKDRMFRKHLARTFPGPRTRAESLSQKGTNHGQHGEDPFIRGGTGTAERSQTDSLLSGRGERETVTWAAFKQNLLRTQASTINQRGAAGRALATDSPPASPAVTKTKRSLGSGITNKTNR